jgi:hypothetical protein
MTMMLSIIKLAAPVSRTLAALSLTLPRSPKNFWPGTRERGQANRCASFTFMTTITEGNTMKQLTRDDLFSLEKYSAIKNDFRAKVMEHKKHRRVPIGDHAALYFEDALTMQYQVQEMLRLERIFEADGIQEELDVYNPLIPNGSNWKATFMLEYDDVEERKKALAQLIGIENTVWVKVGNFDKVFAISNEDLDRTAPDKTSAVHFMRFELTAEMIAAAKQGATIKAGIDHPTYHKEAELPAVKRDSLAGDLK